MSEKVKDTDLEDEVPTADELIATYALAIGLWSPVLLAATGNLVPLLEVASQYTIEPLIKTTAQTVEILGASASNGEATATTTTTTTPTATSEGPPSSQNLSPGGFLLVGIIQLVIAGIALVFGLVIVGSLVVVAVVYVLLLFSSLKQAFADTRQFIAYHRV